MKFNPLKLNLFYVICKNLVRTSKRTQHFTIAKINWLMLFKEIIAVYTKPIKTKCEVTDVKSGGTYSYHYALRG
jgi:hypothetical protein